MRFFSLFLTVLLFASVFFAAVDAKATTKKAGTGKGNDGGRKVMRMFAMHKNVKERPFDRSNDGRL